ncbi:DDE-type integrase/transposase/recombinase, partial [Klebsiella pneumoniae]|uniref:DDE-type integrase/transposase/recombinase n=1 Tax=Klebsiella pneumoniae TaxID=573 RepID=UPI00287B9822
QIKYRNNVIECDHGKLKRIIGATLGFKSMKTAYATIKGLAVALLKREGRCPSDVEHRQIKYRNNVIECDHGKLKRIIGATLGFKSMKTAYATIKGIEVMRALRKGQASAFYYGDPLGEMRLVSRVFEM